MPKPLPKVLKGAATLNAAEIELAANPLRDCTFEFNDVEWWIGFRPNKVLADAMQELGEKQVERLLSLGLKKEELTGDDWQEKLTDEQLAKLNSLDSGLRPLKIKAYVPAIDDWNLPETMGFTEQDFLTHGGIYDAALEALEAAFSPIYGGATAEAPATSTPSSPDGATPSIAGATENQTTGVDTSRPGQPPSTSPKNTGRQKTA